MVALTHKQLEALKIGDRVGVAGGNYHDRRYQGGTVVKFTATQITVRADDSVERRYIRRSGHEWGTRSSLFGNGFLLEEAEAFRMAEIVKADSVRKRMLREIREANFSYLETSDIQKIHDLLDWMGAITKGAKK